MKGEKNITKTDSQKASIEKAMSKHKGGKTSIYVCYIQEYGEI